MHGIDAGRDFSKMTDMTVVYVDLGISSGMEYALMHADDVEHPVIQRGLPEDLWFEFVLQARTAKLKIPLDNHRLEAMLKHAEEVHT